MDKIAEINRGIAAAVWKKPDSLIIDQEDWFQIITPSSPHPWHNRVIRAKMTEAEAPERVRQTLAAFKKLTPGFVWFVPPDSTPSTLPELLEKAGMTRDHAGIGMIAEVKNIKIEFDPKITVEIVTADNAKDYTRATCLGWENPHMHEDRILNDLMSALKDPHHDRIYLLARHNGSPAGTGSLVPLKHSGYLLGSSVVPEFRGKGVYRALVRDRIERLGKMKIPFATIHAMSNTSAPVCNKLGFETVCEIQVLKKMF